MIAEITELVGHADRHAEPTDRVTGPGVLDHADQAVERHSEVVERCHEVNRTLTIAICQP